MLNVNLIGYLGSDAEVKNANGKDFVSFRVANTDRWTDQAGQQHENTIWVDCVMSGKPAVVQYLLKGTLVFVSGSCSLRVYSSPKDKCMKAGMSVNVNRLELLGGKTDEVPSRLYDTATGQMLNVVKYYGVAEFASGTPDGNEKVLTDNRGGFYDCDARGWVSKVVEQPAGK